MLYHIAELLGPYFGPMRLLQSYAVLISLGLFLGFLITVLILPKFYSKLPKDRGREFTVNPEAAVGKPTGGGVVFIYIEPCRSASYCLLCRFHNYFVDFN